MHKINFKLKHFSNIFYLILLIIISFECQSSDKAVTVFESNEDYEYTVENLTNAIIARGMVISNTVNLSDMLNRTGMDLGIVKPIYQYAKTIEFCSAQLSHKLSQVDPRNLVICPFAMSVYSTYEKPEIVYIAYRRYELVGDSQSLISEIHKMLKEIAIEASKF